MKPKQPLFLLLLCVAFSISARGQQYYSFSQASEPYTELRNPQLVNNRDSIAESYKWNVPGAYYLFNERISSNILISRDGFILCGNPEHVMPVSPYLAYLEKRDSTSSISVLKEDNIVKVQWKNMGLKGHPAGDFVNFQLWFYVGQPRVEFRYGKGQVTDTAAFSGKPGADVVLGRFNSDLTEVYEYHHLVGDPAVPADDTVGIGESLTAAPAEGTVYRFQYVPAGIARVEVPSSMRVYPNPAKDFVTIDGVAPNAQYMIVDLSGRIIASGNLGGNNMLDITRVPKGMYMIRVHDKDTMRLSTLIKE